MNISRYAFLSLSLCALNATAMEPIDIKALATRARAVVGSVANDNNSYSEAGMPKTTIFKEEAVPAVRIFQEAVFKVKQIEEVEAVRPGNGKLIGVTAAWVGGVMVGSVCIPDLYRLNPYLVLLPFATNFAGGAVSYRLANKQALADEKLAKIRATMPQLREKFNALPFEQKKETLEVFKENMQPALWQKVRAILEDRKKAWSLEDQAKALETLKRAPRRQQNVQDALSDQLWSQGAELPSEDEDYVGVVDSLKIVCRGFLASLGSKK
jgi:hypothetical protein